MNKTLEHLTDQCIENLSKYGPFSSWREYAKSCEDKTVSGKYVISHQIFYKKIKPELKKNDFVSVVMMGEFKKIQYHEVKEISEITEFLKNTEKEVKRQINTTKKFYIDESKKNDRRKIQRVQEWGIAQVKWWQIYQAKLAFYGRDKKRLGRELNDLRIKLAKTVPVLMDEVYEVCNKLEADTALIFRKSF